MKKMTKISRPWQGTTIGVLNVLSIILMFIIALLLFVAGSWITSFMTGTAEISGNVTAAKGVSGMITSFMVPVAIVIIILAIVGIFIAKGVFNGAKWAIIVNVVLATLGALGSLGNLSGGNGLNTKMALEATKGHSGGPFISLVIYIAIIALGVMCHKDPFYNQEK